MLAGYVFLLLSCAALVAATVAWALDHATGIAGLSATIGVVTGLVWAKGADTVSKHFRPAGHEASSVSDGVAVGSLTLAVAAANAVAGMAGAAVGAASGVLALILAVLWGRGS